MKKKIFTFGACRTEDIIVYFIGTEAEFIHISFSRFRHEQALRLLDRIGVLTDGRQSDSLFCREFGEYLRGERQRFSVQADSFLAARATSFQQRVWEQIALIPYGETKTYGDVAAKLGSRRYARAVGRACGANPLALLVPCHRVVGKNNLGGFSGGSQIKARLLEIEGSLMKGGKRHH